MNIKNTPLNFRAGKGKCYAADITSESTITQARWLSNPVVRSVLEHTKNKSCPTSHSLSQRQSLECGYSYKRLYSVSGELTPFSSSVYTTPILSVQLGIKTDSNSGIIKTVNIKSANCCAASQSVH